MFAAIEGIHFTVFTSFVNICCMLSVFIGLALFLRVYQLICCFFSVKGLGLIPGVVGRFDSSQGLRVPHIGWNSLQIREDAGILDDVAGRHVYFVHSYRAVLVRFYESLVNHKHKYLFLTCIIIIVIFYSRIVMKSGWLQLATMETNSLPL